MTTNLKIFADFLTFITEEWKNMFWFDKLHFLVVGRLSKLGQYQHTTFWGLKNQNTVLYLPKKNMVLTSAATMFEEV